ncbi:MAG: PBP1A family penicillin-binding protein [Thermodesulfovibrionales bacterium]|nr:PBP1A family penicillin-binding protein [Thermodesulfovibrionales bacterium]
MGSKRKRKKGFCFKVKLAIVFFILPLLVGAAAGGYFALMKGVPSVEELKHYGDIPSTKVYADDDTLLGEIRAEKGIFVPLKKMPPHLINAVIAVEDSSFWRHGGIDYLAILRAAVKDVIHRRLKEGGSTITQQLAKMTFLTPEKTIQRKLREVALATKIERSLTKEEILELYLNRAYFGHGAYGVEMASRTYFGKPVEEITLPEAALVAGLLKAPSQYSPFIRMKKAKERQALVISRMAEEGFIPEKERQEAVEAAVHISSRENGDAANNYFIDYIRKYIEGKHGADAVYKDGLKVYTTLDRKAQLNAQQALKQGLRALDKRRGWRGPVDHREPVKETAANKKPGERGIAKFMLGLVNKKGGTDGKKRGGALTSTLKEGDIVQGTVTDVKTTAASVLVKDAAGTLQTADAQWAQIALAGAKQKTIEGFNLTKILKPGDVIWVGIKSVRGDAVTLTLEQEPEAQGAVVAVDPQTGFIRALVGGYDYTKSEYNRALYAERQAGSAFKPIIYTAALDSGFTPASIVNDEAVTYKWANKEWSPKNYDDDYYGLISMRDALAYSRNTVTVKLLEHIGIEKAINLAKALGITSALPRDFTLALGSLSISPLELVFSYAAFANGGKRMTPAAVKYVTDSKGKVLESNTPVGEEVISPQTAFLITSMLQDVINYGTGAGVKQIGRPAAGKTGTTNDYRDAWFIGYTPGLLAGVWVGFDDMRPLGEKETGARAAAPVWLRFMSATLEGSEIRNFTVPEGIVTCPVDPYTGLRVDGTAKGAVMEYFRENGLPKAKPEKEQLPQPPRGNEGSLPETKGAP